MKLYRIVLLALFGVVVAWSVIEPASLRNWFLESSPSLIIVVLIAWFNRRLQFSDTSFTMLIVYFALPLVNAHYGVAQVPLGETLGELVGSERNMYDRLVHAASGLLCFLPLRELFVRRSEHYGLWSFVVPFMFVLGLGALYEIGELLAALANPSAGITFTGAQGDLWDAPKDLAWAAVGTLIPAGVIFASQKKQ